MEGRSILLLTLLMVFGTVDTQMNITRAGCGATKLCVETPKDCDPAGSQTCLFMSVANTTAAPNITSLSFELSGQPQGYVALGLVNASEMSGVAFICTNSSSNGTVLLNTRQIGNSSGTFTSLNKTVSLIQGSVNGSLIQCQFNLSSESTTFSVYLYNTTDLDQLQPLNAFLRTGPLDLTNPKANVTILTTNGSSAGTEGVTTSPSNTPTTSAASNTPTTSAASNTPTTSAASNNPTTSAASNTPTTSAASNTPTTSAAGNNSTTSAASNNSTTSAAGNNSTTSAASNNITMATTMATTMTTKGASGALHPQALLLLLSILTVSVLQKA